MSEGAERRKLLRRQTIVRRVSIAGSLVFLGFLAGAVPEWFLHRGTQQARECFSRYAEPRGPETPPCGEALKSLRIPARFPWTTNRARYRIEEIGARIAHYEYVEAAVGKPDQEALTRGAEAIEHQAMVVQNGTTRPSLKDLGPSVGSPDPGREADEIGDYHTLLERGEQWFNWRVRLSTMRAALLAGDLEKTKSLAKRYAVDDPRDPDIRSAVAAVLCMGPDREKGAEMLVFMQDDRASRKYEGMTRDYGEVRALLTACLALRNLPPPPLPKRTDAGSADATEQRALLRLRLAGTPAGDASQPAAIATVTRLLDGGPRNPGARLALLAAILATGSDHDPETIVRYSKPKYDESPLAPATTLTALEWVTDHRPPSGDSEPAAILPGSTYLVAAHTVETLLVKLDEAADATKPKADKEQTKDKEDNATRKIDQALQKQDLVALRGALLLEAAASLTRDGRPDDALRAIEAASPLLNLRFHARNLLRSNVYWLSGDRERAFLALDTDGNIIHGADATQSRLLAAMAVQESELALSLGKQDIAKQAAHRAVTFATKANDLVFLARALWMQAALGEIKAPVPDLELFRLPLPFPSAGFNNPQAPWRAGSQDKQHALLESVLAPWIGLSGADANTRRAGRWAAIKSRGDAPPWLSVHLLLASRLLKPEEGDMEVWLDALLALDQRRYSLRSQAFARAEAARMRGDMTTAAKWDERFRTLCKLAAELPHYEFTRHLDL